jgi:hypothetical protein
MPVTVVRYKTKPEHADENQALVEKVFAELDTDRPDGLRYATFRLADGVTFVHVAAVETADGTNPLTSVAAFGAFAAGVADRCAEGDGPDPSAATVVGSYKLEIA